MISELKGPGRVILGGAPGGFEGLLLRELARTAGGRPLLFIVGDDQRLASVQGTLGFFAAEMEVLAFPAWDCIPYDRVSPRSDLLGRRIETLTRLTEPAEKTGPPRVVLTTIAAALQRLVPRDTLTQAVSSVRVGDRLDPSALASVLVQRGYVRADTVMERGDYALRGGIIDVFPPGVAEPLRLDFFGDELDSIRTFDPLSQRTTGRLERCTIKPVSEVMLDEAAIARFRSGYRALFGAVTGDDDPLYASISAGRRHPGMEHWLPLFHPKLATLFDYLPAAVVVLDEHIDAFRDSRLDQIAEHYAARKSLGKSKFAQMAETYRPIPPEALFISGDEFERILAPRTVVALSPFAPPDGQEGTLDAGGRPGIDFAEARRRPDVSLFNAVIERIRADQAAGRRVVIGAVSAGSRDRLMTVLKEHGLDRGQAVANWSEAKSLPPDRVSFGVLPLAQGFITADLAVIAEQDILGDRMGRRVGRRSRPENFLIEASALNPGDLVVHVDHGIGRYEGLETVTVDGAAHDCLRLVYASDDKLYLPVENIDVISRYGADSDGVQLDRLGGALGRPGRRG